MYAIEPNVRNTAWFTIISYRISFDGGVLGELRGCRGRGRVGCKEERRLV
jgi:hypothetical protein